MIHRIKMIAAALLLPLLIAADPPATAPSTQPAEPKIASPEMLAHLQQSLTKVDTQEADFVEKKRLVMLKHTVTLRGHLALAKPNKVILIVKEPSRFALKVDGPDLTQWDEETNKVQHIPIGNDPSYQAITQQIQAWFLGDYKQLENGYQVYQLSDDPLSLRFVPSGDTMVGKLVKSIEVTFNKDRTQIDKMAVYQTTGDWTTFEYSNTRQNQPIKDETWEIPPK